MAAINMIEAAILNQEKFFFFISRIFLCALIINALLKTFPCFIFIHCGNGSQLLAGIPDQFELFKILPVGIIFTDPLLHQLFLPGRCFTQQVFYQQVIINMVKLLFQVVCIIN